MTDDRTQLMYEDICKRLPYGVKVCVKVWNEESCESEMKALPVYSLNTDGYFTVETDYELIQIAADGIVPYLRSVSSMTDAEMDRLFDVLGVEKDGGGEDWIKINDVTGIKFFLQSGRWMEEIDRALSYLRSIHIDIYGFIAKGLAIEAPSGLYGEDGV